jgi:hypothetical protein
MTALLSIVIFVKEMRVARCSEEASGKLRVNGSEGVRREAGADNEEMTMVFFVSVARRRNIPR